MTSVGDLPDAFLTLQQTAPRVGVSVVTLPARDPER